MQTNELIVKRFFIAMDYLKQTGVVHGTYHIAHRLGIDRRNLLKVKKQPETRGLRLCWLAGIVTEYGINPRWLLTGEGEISD